MARQPSSRSNQILLVDGDLRTSNRLAELLREDGFEVDVLRDGLAARDRLACAPMPGTLITELALPLSDGESLARFARSRDASVRVVVLTRHPHLVVPGRLSGPLPVVMTKPLDYPQLLDVLRGANTTELASVAPASPRN
jgi:DNA-binding response OmpR family regulator